MYVEPRIPKSIFTVGTIPAGGIAVVSLKGAPQNCTVTIKGVTSANMGLSYDTDGTGNEAWGEIQVYASATMKIFKCNYNSLIAVIFGTAGDRYTIV